MLTIRYSPQDFSFTSSIPDRIDISTDAASVIVAVQTGTSIIFETELFPYNKIASLYDLRSIIEDFLAERRLTHANFVITADSDTEEAMTPERTFIYSRLNIPYWSGAVYIQHHFLTTLSSFVLPRNAVQCISFLALPNKTLTCYTECLIHAAGEPTPRVVRLEENPINYTALRLCAVNVMPEQYLQRLKINGKLLQVTVHRGDLAKTFYITDRSPNLTLTVRNEFNCIEFIHLNCVTKRKLALDRSTATCLGLTTFYDDKSAYEHEVESSMLSFEQANHISQLLLTNEIYINEQSGVQLPIVITDLTSEVSDADNATNSIKFKWKYAKHRFPAASKLPLNIFDTPFHRTFD